MSISLFAKLWKCFQGNSVCRRKINVKRKKDYSCYWQQLLERNIILTKANIASHDQWWMPQLTVHGKSFRIHMIKKFSRKGESRGIRERQRESCRGKVDRQKLVGEYLLGLISCFFGVQMMNLKMSSFQVSLLSEEIGHISGLQNREWGLPRWRSPTFVIPNASWVLPSPYSPVDKGDEGVRLQLPSLSLSLSLGGGLAQDKS